MTRIFIDRTFYFAETNRKQVNRSGGNLFKEIFVKKEIERN